MLSPDVVQFLQIVLTNQTIPTSNPNFKLTADLIDKSLRELAAMAPDEPVAPVVVLPEPEAPKKGSTPQRARGVKKAAATKRTRT